MVGNIYCMPRIRWDLFHPPPVTCSINMYIKPNYEEQGMGSHILELFEGENTYSDWNQNLHNHMYFMTVPINMITFILLIVCHISV
jgi:hypothetical protein